MATLDLSKAKFSFYMTNPDLVSFGANDGAGTPTGWSYLTTGDHDVLVKGQGMTFNAAGRPTGGTATSIEIDVGNDDPNNPELVITGINVAAATLDDGPASFWRFLEGDDVILGPELAKGASGGTFIVFGDGIAARNGATGGRDVIHLGDGYVQAAGDVTDVGSQTAGAPTADYRGGNDELLGLFAYNPQIVSGDAFAVYAGSRLTGGNDSIVMQSTYSGSSAVGDAYQVVGTAGNLARVTGGNDYLSVGYGGTLSGDIYTLQSHGFVQGGDDTINGGISNNLIVGDVYRTMSPDGTVIGGDDVINGGGGDDTISGDVYSAYYAAGSITGGDDTIRGGAGNDRIYGDSTDNNLNFRGVGGNDRLYGGDGSDRLVGHGGDDILDGGAGADELDGGQGNDWLSGGADNDRLYGWNGDDQLDGAAGADYMAGGAGSDTYYVNSGADVVAEYAGVGIDTVWSSLAGYTLTADVENLRYNGAGSFTGTGNDLANTIAGLAGNDRLEGGGGDDLLIGGAGADALIGSAGIDTASYAAANEGVDARLLGAGYAGDALGDSFSGVENLTGSGFGDVLYGENGANTLAGGDGGDYLDGQDGNDVLRGGRGADLLVGGRGDDVFDFDAAAESAPGARDIVRADIAFGLVFEGVGVAGGDRIDLSGIDANASKGGNQAFAFGSTGKGHVSLVDSGSNTVVRCNTDGDSAFEFELVIEDGGVLAAAYRALDFIL
jgi:Ca2+-binding RTX toxin-like protein